MTDSKRNLFLIVSLCFLGLFLNINSETIQAAETFDQENIIELLQIYSGDFLEEGYSWAIASQQKYREMILNKIEKFARKGLEEEKLDLILKSALDKAYEIDSFNGNIAEMMIHYYGMLNNKSNLDSFFNKYESDLWEEMKLEPSVNILNIYNRYMEED